MEPSKKFEVKLGKHRGSSVIFCAFEYDKEIINRFKNKFPFAKGSATNKMWYLPDTKEIRSTLSTRKRVLWKT